MFINHLVEQHLPSWFPGIFFSWKAQEYSQIIQQMQDYLFDGVQKQMVYIVIKKPTKFQKSSLALK